MNNTFRLQSLAVEELAHQSYDLLLAAQGYESRATAVSQAINKKPAEKIAIGFDHNKVESFEANAQWFQSQGFDLQLDVSSDGFQTKIKQVLESSLSAKQEPAHIAIDISCFDRRRLAEIISLIREFTPTLSLTIDFWYCIAQFEKPNSSLGRNEIAGPVHRRFAGKFFDPGRPLALIAGLGYELGRVMGAAEYLQASRVIALFPESPIEAYEAEVNAANKLLLDDLKPREIIRYRVDDPMRTVATLDSIIRGLSQTYNIVMLPGGPKIFVLACLLAQSMHPSTAVWRVSSGASIKPKNVQPSEYFVGLRYVRNLSTHIST